ncbi:hypothetical protein CH063_09908, partial [Colletotrichum higginsianum]
HKVYRPRREGWAPCAKTRRTTNLNPSRKGREASNSNRLVLTVSIERLESFHPSLGWHPGSVKSVGACLHGPCPWSSVPPQFPVSSFEKRIPSTRPLQTDKATRVPSHVSFRGFPPSLYYPSPIVLHIITSNDALTFPYLPVPEHPGHPDPTALFRSGLRKQLQDT